jgi:chemotaxis protein histidine kinase CheA
VYKRQILGDGTVALVMDTNKMIKSFLIDLDKKIKE